MFSALILAAALQAPAQQPGGCSGSFAFDARFSSSQFGRRSRFPRRAEFDFRFSNSFSQPYGGGFSPQPFGYSCGGGYAPQFAGGGGFAPQLAPQSYGGGGFGGGGFAPQSYGAPFGFAPRGGY